MKAAEASNRRRWARDLLLGDAMSLQVVPLERRHVQNTARVLAQAMQVDAAYQYLFPDPEERLAGLARLFAGNLRAHLPYRCTYVGVSDQGRIVATLTLRPPEGIVISKWTMLRSGMIGFALAHGKQAVRRLLWLKATYDALEAELAKSEPHWYVHMMAVGPDQQGLGLGTELLAQVLSARLSKRPDLHTVLTTHIPRNLFFYQRASFETAWQRSVEPPDGAPYPVWGMTREPLSASRALSPQVCPSNRRPKVTSDL